MLLVISNLSQWSSVKANPRALNKIDKSKLGVLYRHNKQSWMTAILFENWFKEYFAPTVESYLLSQGLPKRAILVIDNAPVHKRNIADLFSWLTVIFMPPNCSCVLQPMDKSVIIVQVVLCEKYNSIMQWLDRQQRISWRILERMDNSRCYPYDCEVMGRSKIGHNEKMLEKDHA